MNYVMPEDGYDEEEEEVIEGGDDIIDMENLNDEKYSENDEGVDVDDSDVEDDMEGEPETA